jgi:hypothetical protein
MHVGEWEVSQSRMRSVLNWAVLIFAVIGWNSNASGQELIPAGSTWKYWDQGTLPASWSQADFDDSAWPSGPAQLGCGENDEITVMGRTESSHARTLCFFRHEFSMQAAEEADQILLRWLVDDGAVFYLNGQEIHRAYMPAGELSDETRARSGHYVRAENRWDQTWLPKHLLQPGRNTLAVAVYQINETSSDVSFDLRLSLDGPPAISRGPYLQMASQTSMTLRWRTPMPAQGWVRYGTDPKHLDLGHGYEGSRKNHTVTLNSLQPSTTYYYVVASGQQDLTPTQAPYFFTTAPEVDQPKPFRTFVFGDSGTASRKAAQVRDAVLQRHQKRPADFWLMLGDNAYNNGTDAQYQRAVFDFYPTLLSHLPLWSTRGNHETLPKVYYRIFDLPTKAETGGLASGTEAYYSFDWSNVHFICLDSQGTDRSADGAMVQWLEQDMAQTDQQWIVAFWHHPPYTKGTHDSDNVEDSGGRMSEMREQVLPTLEAGGVDLVLGGHSHTYERTYMIGGHYGLSTTFQPQMILDGGDGDPNGDGAYQQHAGGDAGTVYVVAGSSGSGYKPKAHHPAMFRSSGEMGAVALDFDAKQLQVTFIGRKGDTLDVFRLVREPDVGSATPPEVPNAPK